jgi:hypothetical protein
MMNRNDEPATGLLRGFSSVSDVPGPHGRVLGAAAGELAGVEAETSRPLDGRSLVPDLEGSEEARKPRGTYRYAHRSSQDLFTPVRSGQEVDAINAEA